MLKVFHCSMLSTDAWGFSLFLLPLPGTLSLLPPPWTQEVIINNRFYKQKWGLYGRHLGWTHNDAVVLVVSVLLVRLLPFFSVAVVVVISGVQGLLWLVDEAAASTDGAQSQLGHRGQQGGPQTRPLGIQGKITLGNSPCLFVFVMESTFTFSPSELAAFSLAFFSNLDKGSIKTTLLIINLWLRLIWP